MAKQATTTIPVLMAISGHTVATGLVLKGTKPADLPVAQPTKFDMVIHVAPGRVNGAPSDLKSKYSSLKK
jgi:hypothetical protein